MLTIFSPETMDITRDYCLYQRSKYSNFVLPVLARSICAQRLDLFLLISSEHGAKHLVHRCFSLARLKKKQDKNKFDKSHNNNNTV